jgi:undecaprenyl-diphosphatase
MQGFFAVISRLGDGVFWYCLIALLPMLFGAAGLHTAIQMVVTGVLALSIYKLIKSSTERPRPFRASSKIRNGAPALDEYSFPSGHTLHAVAFSFTACAFHPSLAWFVLPFTMLVAMSRLVLGLHYVTDVVAGAVLGIAVATLVQSLADWLGWSLLVP